MHRWLRLVTTVVVTIVVDYMSKKAVIDVLQVGESVTLIPVLSPLFLITYSRNSGAAFGFLPQASPLFLVFALLAVVFLVIFYFRIPEGATLTQLAIGLISGGALGNAISRLQYGTVIDFIHYQVPSLFSNVSNMADHVILLGVMGLFYEQVIPTRIPSDRVRSSDK